MTGIRPPTAAVWQLLGRLVVAAMESIQQDRVNSFLDRSQDEAVSSVRELYRLRAQLDELIDAEIIRARDLGAPWDLLGSSRQQAQQRAARARQRQQGLTNHVPEVRHFVNHD